MVRRSEEDLRSLIALNPGDLETVIPHPLALAIGWPTGLVILLESGMKPSVAIEAAITQEDVQSVELLLDYGCPMVIQGQSDEESYSLIEYAMATSSPLSLISTLTERMAERRRELLKVASENLPEVWLQDIRESRESRQQSIGEGGESVLDYRADMIFKHLHRIGVDEIENLNPGTKSTIYHNNEMTYPIAKTFYEAGFHDIDIPDEGGRTPITKRVNSDLTRDGFRLVLWYLRKGANPCRKIPDGPNLLHLFSHTSATFLSSQVWDWRDWGSCNAIGVFGTLYDFSGLRDTDGCSCWCSSCGCSPVAVVLKRHHHDQHTSPINSLIRRRRWLFHLPRYSSMRLHLTQQVYEDICRLEIFDRLGMAHTCGRYEYDFDIEVQYYLPDSEERQEFRDEDSELKTILDAYLELYLEVLGTYSGDFEIFWIAWLIALEVFLPPQWDEDSYTRYPRIRMPGNYATVFCGLSDQGRSHEIRNYGPDKEGILSALRDFILTLDGGIEEFLGQFVPTGGERDLVDYYMEHGAGVYENENSDI